MRWSDTAACHSCLHCQACRMSEAFRRTIVASGFETTTEFTCPIGLPIGKEPTTNPLPLGDYVAAVAQPIAAAIDRVAGTHLATCKPCQRRRRKMNRIGARIAGQRQE